MIETEDCKQVIITVKSNDDLQRILEQPAQCTNPCLPKNRSAHGLGKRQKQPIQPRHTKRQKNANKGKERKVFQPNKNA
jgi:hypothetical protein